MFHNLWLQPSTMALTHLKEMWMHGLTTLAGVRSLISRVRHDLPSSGSSFWPCSCSLTQQCKMHQSTEIRMLATQSSRSSMHDCRSGSEGWAVMQSGKPMYKTGQTPMHATISPLCSTLWSQLTTGLCKASSFPSSSSFIYMQVQGTNLDACSAGHMRVQLCLQV